MNRISATSGKAKEAARMLSMMQLHFVNILETINTNAGYSGSFKSIEWYRNAGKLGGGTRYISPEKGFFNSGSVNFSQIQYEKESDKSLRSATALSRETPLPTTTAFTSMSAAKRTKQVRLLCCVS